MTTTVTRLTVAGGGVPDVTGGASTAKDCCACASPYSVLPDCVATIVQVPGARKLTVCADIEQIEGAAELYDTGRPDDAVALTAELPPTLAPEGGADVKLTVCARVTTLNSCP